MNRTEACYYLDITEIEEEDLDETLLKRKYRKQALIYHPDKNPSPNVAERFHKIRQAYEYLEQDFDVMTDDEEGLLDDDYTTPDMNDLL
jgi:DnaJ-class molecular chaperone